MCMKSSSEKSLELSDKAIKRSSELRKDIDKEIGFTEKQNKVLDNLKPLKNQVLLIPKEYKDILGKKITKTEWLQKRRTELFIRIFNNHDMEKENITPDLRTIFSGKIIKGMTFDQAIEIATPKKEISAKIIEVKEKKKEGFWNSQKQIWKSAFSVKNDNSKTCIYCNHTFPSKKKLKKHMKKENKIQMKIAKRERKAKKKFAKKLKAQNIKNDKVKSLIWKERNLAYYKDQDGDYRRSRRGSYRGNGLGVGIG